MSSDPTTGRIWPTPRLIRAARGLANVDQESLAAAAGVSRKAVISLEGDTSKRMDYRRLRVLQKLQRVLQEKWRIEFLPESRSFGTGVRERKAKLRREFKRKIARKP